MPDVLPGLMFLLLRDCSCRFRLPWCSGRRSCVGRVGAASPMDHCDRILGLEAFSLLRVPLSYQGRWKPPRAHHCKTSIAQWQGAFGDRTVWHLLAAMF